MQTTCTNIWNLTVMILLCDVTLNIMSSLTLLQAISPAVFQRIDRWVSKLGLRLNYLSRVVSCVYVTLQICTNHFLFKFYDWKTFLRILTSQALTYSVFSLGDVPMRPLGCFQDKKSPSRPLPELIFTDNDPQSTLYSGFNVQSDDWQQYMPELICRFVIL